MECSPYHSCKLVAGDRIPVFLNIRMRPNAIAGIVLFYGFESYLILYGASCLLHQKYKLFEAIFRELSRRSDLDIQEQIVSLFLGSQ